MPWTANNKQLHISVQATESTNKVQVYFAIENAFTQSVQVLVCFVVSEVGVSEEDAREIVFANRRHSSRKLVELQLEHFVLQMLHKPAHKQHKNSWRDVHAIRQVL